jgi:hypothetical protein
VGKVKTWTSVKGDGMLRRARAGKEVVSRGQ